ncbi:MAG: AEC family transporter [Lachnospiraceae bacterium]|nr:AEC family transporter [Lachnospiraceae bacterium]
MVVQLFWKIMSMALMMAMGIILVKSGIAKSQDSKPLSMLSVYLIMPCVVFKSFQVDFTPDVQRGLLLALIGAVAAELLLILLNEPAKRLLRLDPIEQASVIYTNAGNLIIPLVSSVIGPQYVIYTTMFIAVERVLMFSHGIHLLRGEKKTDWKAILLNNNIICIVIGIVIMLTGFRFPAFMEDAIDSVAGMLGPMAMLITGMLVGGMSFKKTFSSKRLWLTVGLRLLVMPVFCIVFLKYCGLTALFKDCSDVLIVTVLACITPSASTVTQLSQVYTDHADYAGAINVASTFLCILTMPCMAALYNALPALW